MKEDRENIWLFGGDFNTFLWYKEKSQTEGLKTAEGSSQWEPPSTAPRIV